MSGMSESAKEVLALSMKTFSKKASLNTLWQEIANNFYPERADFTTQRSLGSEFAEHLMDSYPCMVRRDLANSITSMLRPKGKDWGAMTVVNEDMLDNEARRWLEWAWKRQRAAMYERASMFTRATKEGDHDFSTFGQCVLHTRLNRDLNGLLYRSQHLRDAAWLEGVDGAVDTCFMKRRLSALALCRLLPGKVHPKVLEMKAKEPLREVSYQHIVLPAEQYPDVGKHSMPYVSLYLDTDNQHVMEAVPSRTLQYTVPRWQTVSGSQYAYSPATITALPDARLIQAMTLILLEAGEKFVNPPLVATQEVVRSDVALYAGGITWVDQDYDERLGEALRPLTQDRHGVPLGLELSERQKMQLREAFYLNQISGVPRVDKEMTAYEASQHVQDYIRQAMPLFEPMEFEYNGGLCEETFSVLFWQGAFGSLDSIPKKLQGADIEFKFKSPLHDAEGREKGTRLLEAIGLMEPLMAFEPAVKVHFDIHSAFRDALEGLEVPSKWLTPEQAAANAMEAMAQEAKAAAMAEMMRSAGEAGQAVGKAGQEIQRAEA